MDTALWKGLKDGKLGYSRVIENLLDMLYEDPIIRDREKMIL